MKRRTRDSSGAGFTLIELVVTLAIVGLLAMTALPLYEVTMTRLKEAELRQALRTIRAGLDAYKAATDSGLLSKSAGESGYPPSLEVLTQPLEMANQRNSGWSTTGSTPRLVILRQLPRDPFHPDRQLSAASTWNTRAYASRPDSPSEGDDVFDVSSKSDRVGLDGTPYRTW
jgi:general secretion pathway protein G